MGLDVDPDRLRSTYDVRYACEVNGTRQTDGSIFSSSISVLSNGVDHFSQSDLDYFNAMYGLQAITIEGDIPSDDGLCVSNPVRCMESNLDTQYVSSTARNCRVRFEKVGSKGRRLNLANVRKATTLVDQMAMFQHRSLNSEDASSVFSVSYGIGDVRATESEKTFFADWIMETALSGTVVVVSSGDDGAKGEAGTCELFDTTILASPYALVVGATAFNSLASASSSFSGSEEVACQCDGSTTPKITTGGGFSRLYTDTNALAFQQNLTSAYLSTIESDGGKKPKASAFVRGGRGFPDVALVGQNYVVYIGGEAFLQDGTSASTPVVAGMLAIVQSMRAARGKNPLPGWLNPTLYDIYANDDDDVRIFRDITSGDNTCGRYQETPTSRCTSCCETDTGSFGWRAIEGWDAATGLGSFNFTALADALLEIETPSLPKSDGASLNLGVVVGLPVGLFFLTATLFLLLVAWKRRRGRSAGMTTALCNEGEWDYAGLLEQDEDAHADTGAARGASEEEKDGCRYSPSLELPGERNFRDEVEAHHEGGGIGRDNTAESDVAGGLGLTAL
eukprot:g2136.t1